MIWAYIGVDDDCPIDLAAAIKVVDGVFIRSRVRNDNSDDDAIFLDVSLSCLARESSHYIFNLDIRMDRWGILDPWALDYGWGSFGIGGEEYIRQALKDAVERALTDFIRAHMDEG